MRYDREEHVDIQRNHLCVCGSGKKLKRCCLDDLRAWQRAGKGIVETYVKLEGGERCPLSEWEGPIHGDTPLIVEINPITAAWARNTLPEGASWRDLPYRGLLLEHFAMLVGGRLTPSLAAELHGFRHRQQAWPNASPGPLDAGSTSPRGRAAALAPFSAGRE